MPHVLATGRLLLCFDVAEYLFEVVSEPCGMFLPDRSDFGNDGIMRCHCQIP